MGRIGAHDPTCSDPLESSRLRRIRREVVDRELEPRPVPHELELVAAGVGIELRDLDRDGSDDPHAGPPHGERTVRRLDVVTERFRESPEIGIRARLDDERPVGQRDEPGLVAALGAVAIEGRDRVPFALTLEPRDARREPLAGGIERPLVLARPRSANADSSRVKIPQSAASRPWRR